MKKKNKSKIRNFLDDIGTIRSNCENTIMYWEEIKKTCKKKKKKIKKLLKESGQRKLETAFPNICAIFKEIERNYEI